MNQIIPPAQAPTTSQQFVPNQSVVINGKNFNVKQHTPGQGLTVTDPTTQQDMAVTEPEMANVKPQIKTTTMAEDMANEVLSKLLDEKLDPIPIKVISTEDRTVANMAKKWNQFRMNMELKSQAKRQRLLDAMPSYNDSRELQFLRAEGASKSVNEKGRDKKTGIPLAEGETNEIEVGLTEFPYGVDKKKNPEGYSAMTMEEMDNKFEEEHDHFGNEKKLPSQTMTREEDSDYFKGMEKLKEKRKDVAESEHPRYSPKEDTPPSFSVEAALDKALGIRTAADEIPQERTKLPVQYKDVKKAPGKDMGYEEPVVIPTAKGDLKEVMLGFKNTQKKIEEIKTSINAVAKPLQDALMAATAPLNAEMNKNAALLSSYLNMLHQELSTTDDKVAAMEDEIYTALDREQVTAPAASLAQILKKAKDIQPELVDAIGKIKALVEAENTKLVLEQYVYKYPVSEVQKKKISSEVSVDQFISEAVEVIKALQAINQSL